MCIIDEEIQTTTTQVDPPYAISQHEMPEYIVYTEEVHQQSHDTNSNSNENNITKTQDSAQAVRKRTHFELKEKPSRTPPQPPQHHHRPNSTIPCDVCHKIFSNRSKMMWHRRMHDENRQRYSCPQADCDRIYASKQACDLHFRQSHLDEGLICPVCHKVFAIRQTLEVHMRYHTGTYPFVCNFCNKKFVQKCHLTTHLQVKHNNLRYICSEPGCSKVFKNSMSLRNHLFVHTGMPFKCAYCDKGYPQKSKLKVHIYLKHNVELSLDDLESMRKFKGSRTRHSFVKLDTPQSVEITEDKMVFEEIAENVEVSL